VAPSFERGILTRIELVPVAERKLLLIVAVKGGLARSILLEVDVKIDSVALEETRRVLNERLSGRSLGEIRATLGDRFKDVTVGDARLIKLFLDHSEALLHTSAPEQVHLEGTANILRQPEFRSQEKVSALVDFLEEKKSLVEVVSAKGIKEGIVITIGRESDRDETRNLSMVTSTYEVGGLKGTIGVIGPTRMPYSKLVSIVDYTAKLLTEILSE
jgi:heat-inducible transcriptional repressor